MEKFETTNSAVGGPPAEDAAALTVRERLVEVAARHFADFGLQGASQRAIQREVGVNASTANYYFGSKEAMYQAVLEAALSRIQASRLEALNQLDENLSHHERVNALLTAYLGAHLQQSSTELGYNYLRIVASLHLVVPDAAVVMIQAQVTPVRELYVDALARLFPNASRNKIYEVLSLAVGLAALAPVRFGDSFLAQDVIERMTDEVVTIATLAFETLCQTG